MYRFSCDIFFQMWFHTFFRWSGISITCLCPSYPSFSYSSPSWFSGAFLPIPVSFNLEHYFFHKSCHEMPSPGRIHRNPVWSSGSTRFCTSQCLSHTTTDHPSVARHCSPFIRSYIFFSSWTGYWPLHMLGRRYQTPTVIDWRAYVLKWTEWYCTCSAYFLERGIWSSCRDKYSAWSKEAF